MTVPAAISYELLEDGRGRLLAPMVFYTPIKGYQIEREFYRLHPDGKLEVHAGYVWDFASGPAIDTPNMVRFSIPHDIFCELTNLRLLPWSVRKVSDRYFYDLHVKGKTPWIRAAWSWLGVSAYSQLVARWKDKA